MVTSLGGDVKQLALNHSSFLVNLKVDVKEPTQLFKRWRGPLALWCGLLSLVGRWDCNEPSVIPLPRIN